MSSPALAPVVLPFNANARIDENGNASLQMELIMPPAGTQLSTQGSGTYIVNQIATMEGQVRFSTKQSQTQIQINGKSYGWAEGTLEYHLATPQPVQSEADLSSFVGTFSGAAQAYAGAPFSPNQNDEVLSITLGGVATGAALDRDGSVGLVFKARQVSFILGGAILTQLCP
jgi:hypothetical protein